MTQPDILQSLQHRLHKEGKLRLRLKIVPKSSTTELVGMLGEDVIKVRVAAVPTKNKANQELIRFLAKLFELPKSHITIASGPTSPLKIVEIVRMD